MEDQEKQQLLLNYKQAINTTIIIIIGGMRHAYYWLGVNINFVENLVHLLDFTKVSHLTYNSIQLKTHLGYVLKAFLHMVQQ